MGARSRNKGANGERELARLLSDELGLEVTRNLLQTREGGHDLNGLPGWCLEVKRRARVAEADKRTWWEQANSAARGLAACSDFGVMPVVAYRADRAGWRFVVPLGALSPGFDDPGIDYTADISLPAFCLLVREFLEVREALEGAGNG